MTAGRGIYRGDRLGSGLGDFLASAVVDSLTIEGATQHKEETFQETREGLVMADFREVNLLPTGCGQSHTKTEEALATVLREVHLKGRATRQGGLPVRTDRTGHGHRGRPHSASTERIIQHFLSLSYTVMGVSHHDIFNYSKTIVSCHRTSLN